MRPRVFHTSRRGSILVVVLWASIGLVSISLLLGNSMLMNYRGVDNDLAGRQADQAIDGAIRYAKTLLTQEETKGNLPDLTSYEGEAVQVGDAEFWFLGRAEGDINGTTREYGFVDEASKLNLNVADDAAYNVLPNLPGMTDQIVTSILNWKTSGGTPSNTAKGGLFESVEELAMVPDMTPEILYGEDTNLNGVLDANEDDGERSLPKDNSDGKLDPGIYEYLTVFTKEPSARPDAGGDRFVTGIVTPGMINDINTMLDSAIPGHTAITLLPDTYTSVIDFFARSGMNSLTEDELDKIAPYFVSPTPNTGQPILQGLVNINTASETVLTEILQNQTVAQDLISARAGRSVPSTGIKWAMDILSQNSTLPGMAYLTSQSYQVSVDIAAVGRHGRGYRRTRVVFDLSGDEPKIVYRRNLAPLGWALGRDAREQLAMKKEIR